MHETINTRFVITGEEIV